MRKINANHYQVIYELENIIEAIKVNSNYENALLDLTSDLDYLSITNSQIDELLINAINDPKNALYNIRWAIDILENIGAVGDEYYL